MNLWQKIALAAMLFSMGSGCAGIQTYEERSATAYNAYAWGATDRAAASFATAAEAAGRNEKLLWQLEAAKAYQAAGDFSRSREWFIRAEDTLREFESEATVVGRDLAAEALQLATNPNVLAYQGLFTDRIFLNAYQALNYFVLGDLEGAAVESRRALYRQRDARDAYASEIARLQSRAPSSWDTEFPEHSEALNQGYTDIDSHITAYAAHFTNPLATWLRAVNHHLRGDWEKARFELQQLENEGMSQPFLRAHRTALEQTLEQGKSRERWCFVIFENGRGPGLREERISLILPKLGLTALSLPKPFLRPRPFVSVTLSLGDTSIPLQTLMTTDALFSAEFKALFPGILMRTLANYVTKEVVSRALVNSANNADQKHLAYTLTGLYKYLSARSDTRIWQTRGNAFMVAAFPLNPTDTVLTLTPTRSDGGPIASQTFDLPLRKDVFIYVQGLNPTQLTPAHVFF